MAAELPGRPGRGRRRLPGAGGRAVRAVGVRGRLLLALVVAGLWSLFALDLELRDLVPGHAGLAVAERFFAHALRPALEPQSRFVPEDAAPLLQVVGEATLATLSYAAAALGLALLFGLLLGFLTSTAWWPTPPTGSQGRGRRLLRGSLLPLLHVAARTTAVLLRSVHELIWAVLFLASMGLSESSAVLAIAIPYTGFLAKVFAELIDETPREAAELLLSAGATGGQAFCFGLLPRAAPDMIAYAFYRMECALRSSAILGFFGLPTLGLHIRQSFDATHYGETWTFLYALIALVAGFDLWSRAVRRRLLP